MPRELTDLEIDSFLARHDDVWDLVDANDRQLVYPQAGLAVLDPSGRYVLVWKDASAHWHFIDLADMTVMQSIATSVNAPRFISDPDYLELIHQTISGTVLPGLEAAAVAIVGAVVLLVLLPAVLPALQRSA